MTNSYNRSLVECTFYDYIILSIWLQPPLTDTSVAAKNEDHMATFEVQPVLISNKHSRKDKVTQELLRQKEQLEHERVCNLIVINMVSIIIVIVIRH